MASGPITARQVEGENMEVVTDFLFLGSKIIAGSDWSHEIARWLVLGKNMMTNLDSVLKRRNITLPTNICIVKAVIFPVGTLWLWELDCREGRTPKNWWLWTVALEKTPESPLDSKEIIPVSLKGDQPWILTGSTDAEAEVPVFWSSDVNRWLTGKVPDAGKDWGQKEKRASEDEKSGWHH